MKINIYDRNLSIEQVSYILPQLDDDMVVDLAHSINNNNDNNTTVEILRQLYIANPECRGVARLYELFEVTPNQIVGNKKKKKARAQKREEHKEDYDHFDGSLQHVENFKPSESPTILPGTNYETNRVKRELGDITDVPAVDFDMPKVPNLPVLD